MAQFEITWEAPEFEYHDKDISWYWMTIIIAAVIIAFSVWERNFLFGFFVVVAEPVVIMLASRHPRMITFALSDSSIHVGEHKSHALKEFESWSSTDLGDGWAELGFNFRARIRIPLRIMVPDAKLDEIRKNLKTLLREVEHETSLLDTIEKLVKF